MSADKTYRPIHELTREERFALMFGWEKPQEYKPMLSTTLLGPYDGESTAEKTIVSASIPEDVKTRLFGELLPRRGAIDKVLTRGLFLLDAYTCEHSEVLALDEDSREAFVNSFFNKLSDVLVTLSPEDIQPKQNDTGNEKEG
jgi:hypothetical protein